LVPWRVDASNGSSHVRYPECAGVMKIPMLLARRRSANVPSLDPTLSKVRSCFFWTPGPNRGGSCE
jgi:hypothetical protein